MKKLILKVFAFFLLLNLASCSTLHLSESNIVSNKDYPSDKKQKIIEYKSKLDRVTAIDIIKSAILSNSWKPGTCGLIDITDDKVYYSSVYDNVRKSSNSTSDGHIVTTVTTTKHETRIDKTYFLISDIKQISIDAEDVYFSKGKLFNFDFVKRNGVDEVALIASLLYIFNVEDK